MEEAEGRLVMPGEKISTEEEFIPSSNVFSENGSVYSAVIGSPKVSEGRIGVVSSKGIYRYGKGMFVCGTVVGDLKSVLFIDIDDIRIGSMRYVSVKDGKIVLPKPRMGAPMQRPQRDEPRPCGSTDIVLARIFAEDDDSYLLSLRDPESGVVAASCERCGSPMHIRNDVVSCESCEYVTRKKVSSLYGNFDAVTELIRDSIENNEEYLKRDSENRRERQDRPRRDHDNNRRRYRE
ncbi:MAG: exosome complex RNA-binding protein Csl4 [Candidatus Marsarchaeota archaeon]|nr:exosome complex RNA-binding protein Csl4 [Candidatus Marsarchaeota archaeon]